MADMYTLYFDGACGPRNPGGTAAYGFTLSKFGTRLADGYAVIGTGPAMTNNVAEYVGLCKGLEAFIEKFHGGYAFLNVRGDSQLVIKQMNKEWKARAAQRSGKCNLYYPYYREALHLCTRARDKGARLTFEWIPREHNTECDNLSKMHLQPSNICSSPLTKAIS